MAKSKFNYKRETTNKLTVTGIITDEMEIVYENEDEEMISVPLNQIYAQFVGQEVNISVSTKESQELEMAEVTEEDSDAE